jgi:hypothetical protein
LFTAQEIEIAIAKHFNYRQNLIALNVSHGLDLLWEADMLLGRCAFAHQTTDYSTRAPSVALA